MVNTKQAAGKYMRVGSKKGPLVIGGAMAKMEQDPTFVYVPMFRVAGPEDEVKDWLNTNHPEKVKEASKSWYSKTTLKSSSFKKAFDSEVDEVSRERSETNSVRSEMKQVNLMALVKLLQIYQTERRTATSSTDEDSAPTQTKSTRTLRERLDDFIKEKRVMDVTSMKENGSDAKRLASKSASSRSRLSQNKSDPLYHVVYNSSSDTSVDGVTNFLKNYGSFTDDQISKITGAVSDGSAVNIERTRSPTRASPLVSPRRRKNNKKENRGELEDLLDEIN